MRPFPWSAGPRRVITILLRPKAGYYVISVWSGLRQVITLAITKDTDRCSPIQTVFVEYCPKAGYYDFNTVWPEAGYYSRNY